MVLDVSCVDARIVGPALCCGQSERAGALPVLTYVMATPRSVSLSKNSQLKRSACLLYAAVLVSACATTAPPVTPNHQLVATIHVNVPESWRTAAADIPEIDPLETNEDLLKFVKKHTAGKNTPRDRMMALASAIFHPEGVGLLYDESATHTAIETFTSGLGNCMGFSNLMVAAARQAGVRANFELMSNYANWQQQGDLLVRTMHVRVVSRAYQRKLVFDFYPEPVSPGAWSRQLDDRQAMAHHLNNLGAQFMQDHDLEKAYAYFNKALSVSPTLSFLWSNMGALLSRNAMPAYAESAYLEAMRLDPEQLTAVSNLQRLYLRTGRESEAEALESRVLSYRERNPFYHFWRAEQAYAEGDYAGAELHYQKAIKLKKDERQFHVGLARAYYKQGKVLAARKAINKSHELFSSDADTITVRPNRR